MKLQSGFSVGCLSLVLGVLAWVSPLPANAQGRVAQPFGLVVSTTKVGAPLLRSVQGRVPRTPAVTLFAGPDPEA